MNKVADFFKQWVFAIILGVLGITLLFTLGCCIYTSITNPFVGIVGIVGAVASLVVVAGLMTSEIKRGL